jgi:hypothetical protein
MAILDKVSRIQQTRPSLSCLLPRHDVLHQVRHGYFFGAGKAKLERLGDLGYTLKDVRL